MKYYTDITRYTNLSDVKAWSKGESIYLKEVLGFGFYKTIFVSRNKNVQLYFEQKEVKEFEKVLEEKLDEEFFDNLCDTFVSLCDEKTKTDEERFELSAKMVPGLIIFDEISKYPDYANDTMLRRLKRLRESTHEVHYQLNFTKEDEPKDFIYFENKLYILQ